MLLLAVAADHLHQAAVAVLNSQAHASASQKIPQSLVDAGLSFVQDRIGNIPLATYVATWLTTLVIAGGAAIQFRGALAKDWNTANSWRDQIVVVVQSTAATGKAALERGDHGSIALYKGKVLLAWPDEKTIPLVKLNSLSMSVAEWGTLYDNATLALCGIMGFVTVFAVHVMIAATVIGLDRPNLFDPKYVPHMQLWLTWIFLWPAAIYLLQHTLIPGWFARLNRSRSDLAKLSEQFGFSATDAKIGG